MAKYHCNIKRGSRVGGQSARAKADYITKSDRYSRDHDEVQYVVSGNLPEWAGRDHKAYWQAADDYSRANANLFTQVEFALPRELTTEQQKALVRDFAAKVTEGKHPALAAIHDKGDGNPHCHLIISQKANDGVERTPEQWFKNKNGGGAPTADHSKSRWWKSTRALMAEVGNKHLQRAGFEPTLDHRSYVEQGIEAEPTEHKGAHLTQLERELAEVEKQIAAEERQLREQPSPHQGETLTARLGAGGLELNMDGFDRLTKLAEEYERERRPTEPDKRLVERARATIDRIVASSNIDRIIGAVRPSQDVTGGAPAERVREVRRSGPRVG